MGASERFDQYMEHLAQGLGHADRHAGLKAYCTGLMLPLSRKSVEPMAARVDPLHASARHQALHHFVAKAEWSDHELLRRVCQWVVPQMDFSGGGWWVIDDTVFQKQGKHSVGVARQAGAPDGRQDNCQVSVSLSLACDQGSVPVAWQLYLPEEWASDPERRARAGVPEAFGYSTKAQIALARLRDVLAEGAPRHCVLASTDYGMDASFRQGLTELGLRYAVGVTEALQVWPPAIDASPAQRRSGTPRPARADANNPRVRSQSVKTLALSLPDQAFQRLEWQEGKALQSARFAAVRVRHAGRTADQQPSQWLLIEQPEDAAEPIRYVLSTFPENTSLPELVRAAHRYRLTEPAQQELVHHLGLGHYEGRGWRGFHHHASLSIAAYGYLLSERLTAGQPFTRKKNFIERQLPALPKGYVPRGSPTRTKARDALTAAPATPARRSSTSRATSRSAERRP